MKKEMQRILILSFLSMLILSFFSTLVFAQSPAEQAAETTKGILTGAGEFLSPLFSNNQLLTRVFFAALIFMIIYSVVAMIFSKNKFLVFAVSIIVTIISMLALPDTFLETIRTSYGAMGAALLSLIPFLIILVFTVKIPSLIAARILWIFFCIYYFALLIYGYTKGEIDLPRTYAYIGAIIAGGIVFFGIGAIRRAIFQGEMGAIKEGGRKIAARGQLLHELQKEELDKSYGKEAAGN